MRCRWLRPVCFGLALWAAGFEPRLAQAQDAAELQQARDKFQRALALQTGGDWAGALALLKEVSAVRATPQVRFNIALCEENLGQLVAAVGDYELAAADAREAKDAEVVEQSRRRLDELKGRIPKVVVVRGDNADTATITLDGITLGDQVIGKEMNVDPGPHVITARAVGFDSFRETVRVAESETKTVTIALAQTAVAEPAPAPTPKGPPPEQPMSPVPAYIVGGIGLASLATSLVMYGLRQDALNELDENCVNHTCPADMKDTADRGKTYNRVGNITLGIGIAGVGVGAVLLLMGKKQSDTGLAPDVSETHAGMSYVGQF